MTELGFFFDSDVLSEICVFLDLPSISSLQQTNSRIAGEITKIEHSIFSSKLLSICKQLFYPHQSLPSFGIFNSTKEFTNFINEKQSMVEDSQVIIGQTMKSLYREMITTPFIVTSSNDENNEVYNEFTGLGGCMDYTVIQPCKIIGWILSDDRYRSEMISDLVIRKFHKFALLVHFDDFETGTINVIYSNQVIDAYTRLSDPDSYTDVFVNVVKTFLGNAEKPKKHGFRNNFMTDVIKQLRPIDLLLNIMDDFNTFLKENPCNDFKEIILQKDLLPYVVNYSAITDDEMVPCVEFIDILTQNHNFTFTPDIALPTTYPKLRKHFLGIEDETDFNRTYDHLIQYDWTAICGKWFSIYWKYSMEEFTHSFYRKDTGAFIVMSTNPQD